MKKILIVNLRRLGDVFSTAHLINSMAAQGDCQISLLTYKESESAAQCVKNVSTLFTIDRKELITLKTNKLFSDGFALEHLHNQVSQITSQRWDNIINFSNDLVGTYLCSYFQQSSAKVTGVHFNEQRTITAQPEWEMLYNSILPEVKNAPIHFVDCLHRMTGTTSTKEGEKLKTNSSYNEIAFKNLSTLRSSFEGKADDVKIIGIQLSSSDSEKNPTEDVVHELVERLLNSTQYIPIILIAPTNEERKMAEEFNRRHNNDIVVVEADLPALTSVLMNIDLVITPDTAIKHMADLTETPVIELSIGHAPFLKQGTYSKDSFILTNVITDRAFKKNQKTSPSRITASDIFTATQLCFGKISEESKLSEGVTLYRSSYDQLGVIYTPILGEVDSISELERFSNRQLIYSMFEKSDERLTYDYLKELNSSETSQWLTIQKDNVTEVMKDLLGTLRSLLQAMESKKGSREFVTNLGKLMSHSERIGVTQIPVGMFKAKIESIQARSFTENAKEVEVILYELKSDIQKVLYCLKEIENVFTSNKMENMVSRSLESSKL